VVSPLVIDHSTVRCGAGNVEHPRRRIRILSFDESLSIIPRCERHRCHSQNKPIEQCYYTQPTDTGRRAKTRLADIVVQIENCQPQTRARVVPSSARSEGFPMKNTETTRWGKVIDHRAQYQSHETGDESASASVIRFQPPVGPHSILSLIMTKL
jgi:hypothetical protein